MSNPKNPLRIIQISDCHVSANPAAIYRGQNADDNLAAVMRALKRWKPEYIIVTGDVSEDGSRESYQRTSAQLAGAGVPVLALPGNHDDPQIMREYFPLGPWEGPQVMESDSWRLILLDSTGCGRISGVLDENRMSAFRKSLQNAGHRHTLVALHHQPVPVGAAWIDRYCLESPQEFLQAIGQAPPARCVIWGHIHHDFRQQLDSAVLLGAPSSVANSLPGSEKFTLDPAGPACRWLELHADGQVETGILFTG